MIKRSWGIITFDRHSYIINNIRYRSYVTVIHIRAMITGGLLCSVLGKKSERSNSKCIGLSRSTVIIISFFINIVAYGLIFVNLPNDSPFGDTYTKSIIKPKYGIFFSNSSFKIFDKLLWCFTILCLYYSNACILPNTYIYCSYYTYLQ